VTVATTAGHDEPARQSEQDANKDDGGRFLTTEVAGWLSACRRDNNTRSHGTFAGPRLRSSHCLPFVEFET
jgi:hypothetical protein